MTHSMPEINSILKQLRLSHIGHHLSQRTRESIDSKFTYPEFLTMLLQDEILGRANIKLTARIKRAKIRGDKTIENFDFAFNPKINHGQINELASCRFIAEKIPVLIVGPCGTGKSHLAGDLLKSPINDHFALKPAPQSHFSLNFI